MTFLNNYNNIMNTKITTSIEKNTLNNSYYLSMSINNGCAWFFSSYKLACKAQKKLEELIENKEKSKHMTYREVTKYIIE